MLDVSRVKAFTQHLHREYPVRKFQPTMKNIQTRFYQNQEYPEIKATAEFRLVTDLTVGQWKHSKASAVASGVIAWIKEYAKACLFPTVFVTDDLTAYGIKKPALFRRAVIIVGLLTKLYKPANTIANLTDMLSLVNPDANAKRNYLEERADVVRQVLSGLGWRRMFIRAVMEVPQNTTIKTPAGVKRETKFYVF